MDASCQNQYLLSILHTVCAVSQVTAHTWQLSLTSLDFMGKINVSCKPCKSLAVIHHHEYILPAMVNFLSLGWERRVTLSLKQFKMKNGEAWWRRAHLSPDALVLLCLQEVEQHLQEGGVLAVGLHHIACAGYLLSKSPQRHLVESQRWALHLTLLSREHGSVFLRLTCLLASDEESCSMSMMMGKSSSIHFLISRPLTWWGRTQQGRFRSQRNEPAAAAFVKHWISVSPELTRRWWRARWWPLQGLDLGLWAWGWEPWKRTHKLSHIDLI